MLAEGMTSRERLLAALRGDSFDRVPWSPCVDGYFLSSLPSDQQLDEAGLHREVGADAMLRHVMLHTWTAPGLGVRTRARKNPRLDVRIESTSGGRLRVSYETQVGTLVEELTLNHESPHIPWFTKRKLETIEDVKIYLYALETATVDPNPEFFRSTVERLGDDGLVTTSGPASPMEQLINLEMGIENLTYALSDDRDTMEQCFEMMHELHRKAYEVIAESEAEVVISYENLSTTLTSPRNYERFDRRHCDDYARICRDAGKIYLTHMCGRLTGFAQQLSEADQDGFIDVAPPPTGDVKFGEAKAGWARDKVLAGGIDATAFTGLTPEEMRRYVRDLLCEIESEAGGFHKFILGSGDALPKNTPVPVIRAVSEAVREHFGTGTATQ
jgi:uroporphyrinogen-III decarboxylase